MNSTNKKVWPFAKKLCLFATTTTLLASFFPLFPEVLSGLDNEPHSSTDLMDSITGGANSSIILKNGKLLSFGLNDSGQLGLGDWNPRYSPTAIPASYFNNEKIIKVEQSGWNTMALTETGKVYIWGSTGFGNKPVLVYEDANIADIEANNYAQSASYPAFFLLMKDGTIQVSGMNYVGSFANGLKGYASLGDCTDSYQTGQQDFSHQILVSATYETCSNNSSWKSITSATPLEDVKKMTANPIGTKLLALTNTNEIYYWGANSKLLATKLNGTTNYNITDVAYGQYPSFLTDEGKVYYYSSWTGNPVEITLQGTTAKAVKIEAASNNLLILTEDGKLYGLGVNTYGSLGPNIPEAGISYSTKQAGYTGISNVEDFGMGTEHTIVRYTDGKYYAFGRNAYGELGSEDLNSKTVFTKNPNLTDVAFVHATNSSSYASTTDNKYYSWGGKETGQLLGRSGPSNVPGLAKDFSSIGTIVKLDGYSETRSSGGVLLDNGSYWNFDYQSNNSTGNPSGKSYTFYELVNYNSEITGPTKILSGAQANYSGTAVGDNGKLYSWGYDNYNLLGLGYDVTSTNNGATVTSGLPAFQEVVIPDGVKFTNVYPANYARYALAENGDVYAWGWNNVNRFGLSGQAGATIKVPTKIPGLPPIKDISPGRWFVLFLDYEGNVWSLGQGTYGSLGLGTTASRSTPIKITAISNVAKIFAGDYDSYAILESGELYAWGRNLAGGLGLGDKVQRNEPRLVSNIANAKELSIGFRHALLATTTGELYVSGSDGEFQLGLGSSQANPNPLLINFPPTATFNNTDNVNYEQSDTLQISGVVEPLISGYDIELSYKLESKSGVTTTHLKTINGASNPEKFSVNFNLSNYPAGAYTFTIVAKSSDGSQTTAALNFAVVDNTAPTVSINPLKTDNYFSLDPLTVTIQVDDKGGSGFEGYKYAVTNSSTKPTSWSELQTADSADFLLNKTGTYYIHIEAFDIAGNRTYKSVGPYNIEMYKANLEAVSHINKMELTWDRSIFGSEFRLTKDDRVIYTGTDTSYTDKTNPETTHTYRLYLWNGQEFVLVDTIGKQTGSFMKELPNIISFPDYTLGTITSVKPSFMDLEHLKYEDLSNKPTAYSINISVTDFISESGNTFTPSWVWKNIKKFNRDGETMKTFQNLEITNTPVELVSVTESTNEPFTHLELPRTGLELSIPTNVSLKNETETFTATMVWDIVLGP